MRLRIFTPRNATQEAGKKGFGSPSTPAKQNQKLIVSAGAIIAGAAVTLFATIPSASAADPGGVYKSGYPTHQFSSGDTSWTFSDSNGSGSIDLNYPKGRLTSSYRLQPHLVATCIPNSLNENIQLTKAKAPNKGQVFNDRHTGEACDYIAHPAANLKGFGVYTYIIKYNWRFVIGGETGTATLNGTAAFDMTGV